MRENLDQDHPVTDYIRSVQAEESARNRRKIIIYATILILCMSMFFLWTYLKEPALDSTYEVYLLEELNERSISQKLENQSLGLIVYDSNTNLLDTIESLQDFKEFVAISQKLITSGSQASTESQLMDDENADTLYINEPSEISEPQSENAESENQDRKSPTPSVKMKPYSVEVIGERVLGNTLTFQIEQFESDKIYIIDFGNGEKRRIRGTQSYAYQRPGRYEVILTAIDANANQQSEYAKSIEILPTPSKEERVTTPTVSENTNRSPSPEENVIQREESISNNRTLTPISESMNERIPNEEIDNPSPILESIGDVDTNTEDNLEETIPERANVSAPLSFAEKMPEFPGGISKMSNFLNGKLEYPVAARDNEIEGTVYIQMVVSADGTLSKFNIAKGIGYGCDEEALRIAKLMPDWTPGEQAGQPVPVIYTIPVVFTIR